MFTWQKMLWDTSGTEKDVVEKLFNETIFPDLKALENTLKQAGMDVTPVLQKYTLDDRMLTRLNWKQNDDEYQVCLQHQNDLSLLLETDLAGKQLSHECYCSLRQLNPRDGGQGFLHSWHDELSRIYEQYQPGPQVTTCEICSEGAYEQHKQARLVESI